MDGELFLTQINSDQTKLNNRKKKKYVIFQIYVELGSVVANKKELRMKMELNMEWKKAVHFSTTKQLPCTFITICETTGTNKDLWDFQYL